MSIVVKDITKIYKSQKALDSISFTIGSGEVVAFIGPNGAGKSTMMKIITGIIPQTSGQVLINGKNIDENPMQIKKTIGYLPENNPLYADMYVREYLEHVAALYKIGKKRKERIKEIIQLTGLEREQHKKIEALSKGYKQRVGLAQALLHDPEILILDEPTTGLDPNQIVEIRNLISSLGKEKTIMLSTHLMQEVEAICDRVIIINQGKIVADDTSKNIQQNSAVNRQTIQVEFKEEIQEEELKSIEGVLKIANLNNNIWLIESDDTKDIRPEIFNVAVKNSRTIIAIQLKEKSLEEVFQELTK